MRWEDERYVRVYTRDTSEWAMLSWEARALFLELLRKADRSGFVAIGRHGVRGLASLIRYPVDVVERALPELADDGCIDVTEAGIAIRNFVEAQEAKQSDRLRKALQREREKAQGESDTREDVTKRDIRSRIVTKSHAESHGVTSGHTASRNVTPSLAEPSLAEPNQPPSGVTRAGAREPAAAVVGDVGDKPTEATDEATRAIVVALEAQPVTRPLATVEFAQRLASHCREHGHPGQWSLVEVIACIEQAATKLGDVEAGGSTVDRREAARTVAGFVRHGPAAKGPRARRGVDLGGQPMSTHWKPVEATPEAIAALPLDPVMGF